MTKLELALIAFSVIETIISAALYRDTYRKKLEYEKLLEEYETAVANLNIWRNAA